LDIIEKECQNNVKGCCMRMFQKWLEKTPDASWNQVLAALKTRSVELNYLADEIEQKLKEKCETYFVDFMYHILYVLSILKLN